MVGMLYERRHTRQISEFGGLKKIVPMLATMLLIATLASVAVPFFNGFVGEFPILLGSWISTTSGQWPTALAATGMILSAVYMLWWYQRLMLGPVDKPVNTHLPDLSRTEWLVLTPLAAVIFWFGLYSTFWTQRMDTSVNLLLPPATESIDEDLPVATQLRAERIRQESPGREGARQEMLRMMQERHMPTLPTMSGGLPPRRRQPSPPAPSSGSTPNAPQPQGVAPPGESPKPPSVPGAPQEGPQSPTGAASPSGASPGGPPASGPETPSTGGSIPTQTPPAPGSPARSGAPAPPPTRTNPPDRGERIRLPEGALIAPSALPGLWNGGTR